MYAQKEKHTTEEVTMTVDARKKKMFYPTWNNTEHNTSLGNTEL